MDINNQEEASYSMPLPETVNNVAIFYARVGFDLTVRRVPTAVFQLPLVIRFKIS